VRPESDSGEKGVEKGMRKKVILPLGILTLVAAAGAGFALAQQGGGPPPGPPLSIKTSAFTDGGDVPAKYGCDVAQGAPMVSPALMWSSVPKAAVTLTLIMHDTDAAPQKGTMDVTHWTVFNIPATATGLPEGVAPDGPAGDGGMQGKNIRGVNGYQAPCPPKGGPAHHYTFELYAVDTKLDVPAGAARADILKAMDGHVVGKATVVGLFHH
jgi:Raf kinase inhibitor-like YbhB/YbcL family protein